MKDYILEISYASDDAATEELVQASLFTTQSTGSSSADAAGTTTVSAYFDSSDGRAEAEESLREIDGIELRSVDRERVDWLDLYQQSLEAMSIGRRFVVAPDPDLIPRDGERLTLIVPQEQAFGTGSHETTSLCLQLLETIHVAGRRGLDVGAGSGILAMAMIRLGAARAIAFDNDVDAFGALRDNRMRNEIAEERMPVFIGSVEALRGGTFDVVTMNILPDVIVALLPEVVRHLAGDATLLLSGILTSVCNDVVRAAALHGLELVDSADKGEWWAGVFARK